MKDVRVWLNHWFSTAYNIINLIKKDTYISFYVIGSNENEVSVLKTVCDEWYLEPEGLNGDKYVDYCIDFCKLHKIDVFVPYRHLQSISKRKREFEEHNVAVVVDEYELVKLLNDKNKAYEFFANQTFLTVPEYHVVNNLFDFETAYSELSKKYGQVCTKFVHDQGGRSYRLIDNNRKGYSALFRKQNTRMTFDSLRDALAEKENFSPLMVMPFLDGDEISADCLNTSSGLIIIPRIKSTTRFERIVFDETIISMCKKIYGLLKMEMPCNIQFKYRNEIPYFLEINTRMSGGIHMSCAATGVNIPNLAVNKALGIEKPWELSRRDCIVSQVEVPVVL